ncbi:TetR/AcrR family transcriptional regulator [Paractinoplanes lichenicola]|uniref:TetR/AcrR family transcriptional regulator n=1 Tax=Paractinoplanes lichenicola TaxID=2802976 RepID=A0ABS1VJ89_9ACTN|nr:TetR/AcrR family transcriptional regulator [Actinoplanes lichenicola]MBL7254785.1 TetR/AcrR family transcriptional regulator [Actinoplanes lichenicola]
MPRVSEDHLTARREQILVAARACFLRKGLHHTSMQDLIKEAGLSVGAVYRYFKSKDEIIAAIAQGVVGGIRARIDAIADRRLPLFESMELLVDVIDEQAGPGGFLPIALQVWGESTIDPGIRKIVFARYDDLRAGVQVIVEHAVESGELPADTDVVATTAAYYSLIPGYALQRMLLGTPDKETYLRGIRTLYNR